MIRKLLKLILPISLIFSPLVASSASVSKVTVKECIVKHSLDLGIDPALALSIAKAESGFRHEARSPQGAVGVFQLMPSTAKRIGYNPWDLSQNIKGGLVYYQMMYKMFGSTERALAAYNAGPGNIKRGYMPKHTKVYVSKIMQEYRNQKSNPDPVIGQVKSKQAQLNQKKATVSNQQPAKMTANAKAKPVLQERPDAKTILEQAIPLEL